MAAFDAHWSRPRRRQREWTWIGATVSAAAALGLGWMVLAGTSPLEPMVPDSSTPGSAVMAPSGAADFVPWPGAHALPPFEGGELRQIDLSVAQLRELGLPAPPTAITVVKADVIVGHDGFARAVRVAQ